MKKPMVYAHRGASRYTPENTMAAFRKAVEMNAQGIELDAHLTRDGQLVVAHDAHLGRTSNGEGMIKDLELGYLTELDFGGWYSKEFAGERIPLLSEVLDLIQGNEMTLNVEIKATEGEYREGIEGKLVELIREHGMTSRVIVSSFNHYCLLRVRERAPDIVIAPLYIGSLVNAWRYAEEIGARAIHPAFWDAPPQLVSGCRANGIVVNTWVVNREIDIRKMAACGVDGIITDVPDVALKVLEDT